MAAGSWAPRDIQHGHQRVLELTSEMDSARKKRLIKLGFDVGEAAELSALHTRNFM
jgi:hypothetical protein